MCRTSGVSLEEVGVLKSLESSIPSCLADGVEVALVQFPLTRDVMEPWHFDARCWSRRRPDERAVSPPLRYGIGVAGRHSIVCGRRTRLLRVWCEVQEV